MTILLDVESRSRADLRKVGGRKYWEDPSSEILCLVWHGTRDATWGLWLPGDPIPSWAESSETLAAHNAFGFDRFGVARFLGQACAPIERWLDTSLLAKRAGLPGSLDDLGTLWLDRPKDKAASRFTVGLSQVRRPTKKTATADYPELTPEQWRGLSAAQKRKRGVLPVVTAADIERVVAYCESDVEIMVHAFPRLIEWDDPATIGPTERRVLYVSMKIEDRGVAFDTALAKKLLAADRANIAGELERLAGEINAYADPPVSPEELRTIVSSPAQFVEATGAPDATKRTVEDLAATGCHLSQARLALASITAGKLRAGIARVHDDGRLRDCHNYYAAHTGRYGGRGLQLQNIPRPAKEFEGWGETEVEDLVKRVYAPALISAGELQISAPKEEGPARRGVRSTMTDNAQEFVGWGETEVEDLVKRVYAPALISAGELQIALRACLVAKPGHVLIDADFAGVEARVLAHLAGDEAALDTIRSGRDAYKDAACGIFGVAYDDVTKPQRQAGKVAVLACGYQGGASAIERFALAQRIDLAAAGVTAAEVVKGWRAAHRPIVQFWYAAEDAFREAVEFDANAAIAGCEFVPACDGTGDVALYLPSGRPIVYRETRAGEMGKFGKRSLSYRGRKGREHIYGGKLVENLVQAVCRDLMVAALVRWEDEGLNPVAHVHDQIIGEVPEADAEGALAKGIDLMRDVPAWAAGYPIDADGHIGRRHRK